MRGWQHSLTFRHNQDHSIIYPQAIMVRRGCIAATGCYIKPHMDSDKNCSTEVHMRGLKLWACKDEIIVMPLGFRKFESSFPCMTLSKLLSEISVFYDLLKTSKWCCFSSKISMTADWSDHQWVTVSSLQQFAYSNICFPSRLNTCFWLVKTLKQLVSTPNHEQHQLCQSIYKDSSISPLPVNTVAKTPVSNQGWFCEQIFSNMLAWLASSWSTFNNERNQTDVREAWGATDPQKQQKCNNTLSCNPDTR